MSTLSSIIKETCHLISKVNSLSQQVQHVDNGGKCGLCGDAFNAKKKLFETGGELALNYTTRVYSPNSNITAVVDLGRLVCLTLCSILKVYY